MFLPIDSQLLPFSPNKGKTLSVDDNLLNHFECNSNTDLHHQGTAFGRQEKYFN